MHKCHTTKNGLVFGDVGFCGIFESLRKGLGRKADRKKSWTEKGRSPEWFVKRNRQDFLGRASYGKDVEGEKQSKKGTDEEEQAKMN